MEAMIRKRVYILACIFLYCCKNPDKRFIHDFIVFEGDIREKNGGFKPTAEQIDKAGSRLFDYLEKKTKDKETIFIQSLYGKVPLQNQLKYYQRRYFGQNSLDGNQIVKIEFVFVRCGGQDQWKKIDYTNEDQGCWWSVQYNLKSNKIYDLNLRTE